MAAAVEDYVLATYLLHGNVNYDKKAHDIAIGLTVGTWTELTKEQQQKMIQHKGKVFDIYEIDSEPRKAFITIGYPITNMTPDLPSILTTVFGKLSMDGQIKLMDLELPDSFIAQFPGPRFGIKGVRNLLSVNERPLLMSIFKQCIGLSLVELDEEYQKQIAGGVDLVKDDEIFFTRDPNDVVQRIKQMEKRNRELQEQSGKKVLYAVNLTGPVTELTERAKRYVGEGASCLLLNVFPYGLDILHRLAQDPDINVPIMAHPSFSGALYPSAEFGVAAPLLLGKIMRWAGADMTLYPSPYGSVTMPKEDSLKIASHLRSANKYHVRAFPVPSAGVYPGLVPLLYRDFGNEVIVNAGGGIHGHPQGATAGAKAFIHAIEAVTTERSLEEYALQSPELYTAIQKWGVKAP
ncbi:2,3-diketo-5-methylthiopentyl-1-phosphate enolase [Fictibacillus sp. NRS-1165]|uniref:2,3-diketo-5-methylthiopentyl-1-phosphate enolase n=1 Tax=Fictibacillus sp. NRS-1165 TaxID=3144463 RepID=UPI003D1DFD1A